MNRSNISYNRRRIVLTVLSVIIFTCTCVAADSPQTAMSFMEPTDWSDPLDGLSIRAFYPPTIGFAEPVSITLEFRIDTNQDESVVLPDSLPLDNLNLTLRLQNTQTGVLYQLKREQLYFDNDTARIFADVFGKRQDGVRRGSFAFAVDCGEKDADLKRYNRDSLYNWRTPREATVHGSLPFGIYIAHMDVFMPTSDSGNWHGQLISPPFIIKVKDSAGDIAEKTFTFPRNLRLEKGPVISWDPDDVDTVHVTTNTHGYLGFSIKSEWGDLTAIGLPECPVVCLHYDLPKSFITAPLILNPKKRVLFVNGVMDVHFHFQLMESPLAPGSSRECPIPNFGNILWERDLDITITRAQYDSLTISELDAYEYHTIMVPDTLHLGDDDSLRFEGNHVIYKEVRIPHGYRIGTRMTIADDSVLQYDGSPRSPLLVMNHVGPNTVIPVSIDIFASAALPQQNSNFLAVDTIVLWTGVTELTNVGRDFIVTEEFEQPKAEYRQIKTCYVPKQLGLNSKLELYITGTDSIAVALPRIPGTALTATLTSDNEKIASVTPDLAELPITANFGHVWNDSMICELNLYEKPAGSQLGNGDASRLWTYTYKIPVTKKQAEKLEQNWAEMYFKHHYYPGH